MITLYRIIDTDDNSIVAEGMSYAQAQETVQFYTQDNPNTVFEIESYTRYLVKGMGRDPDLH